MANNDPAVTKASRLWNEGKQREALKVLVQRVNVLNSKQSKTSGRTSGCLIGLIIGLLIVGAVGIVAFVGLGLKPISEDEQKLLDMKQNFENGTPYLALADALPIPSLTLLPTPTALPTSTSTVTPTASPTSTSTLQPTITSTITPLPTLTSPPATLTEAPDIGGWVFDTDFSALTDSTTYYIYLEAESEVNTWLSTTMPALVIRCENNQYDAFVLVGAQLESEDDKVYVALRYGDGEIDSLAMNESTTGEAMFFPKPSDAINSLLAVNRFVIGFEPYNYGMVEAVFDITGIETAIQPLTEACGRP